jgi:acetoacetyl-[acyl-carrier protein] synthase
VAAIKSYLGHSIGCAGGDQLVMTLGSWAHGLIPGITTMDAPAEDVHREHLQLQRQHIAFGVGEMDLAFINAKGFGGNNASCAVLAPHVAENMLKRRHGADAFTQWQRRNEHTREQAADFDARSLRGEVEPIYHFDHGVLAGEDIGLGLHQIQVPGFAQPVSLDLASPYPDMTED